MHFNEFFIEYEWADLTNASIIGNGIFHFALIFIDFSDGESVTPTGGPGFVDICRDLLRPEILRPLQLVTVYFFFFHSASLTAMRPYMIEVFTQLEVSNSPNLITVSRLVRHNRVPFSRHFVSLWAYRLVFQRSAFILPVDFRVFE